MHATQPFMTCPCAPETFHMQIMVWISSGCPHAEQSYHCKKRYNNKHVHLTFCFVLKKQKVVIALDHRTTKGQSHRQRQCLAVKSDWLSGMSLWLWPTESLNYVLIYRDVCYHLLCLCVNQWYVCCVCVCVFVWSFREAGWVWIKMSTPCMLSYSHRPCGSPQFSIMPSQVNITAGRGNHSPASPWNDTLTLNINASYCLTVVPSIRLMYSGNPENLFVILLCACQCSGQAQSLKCPIILNSLLLWGPAITYIYIKK